MNRRNTNTPVRVSFATNGLATIHRSLGTEPGSRPRTTRLFGSTMTLASVPRYEPGNRSRVGEHAIVIGASMAGLVAGRILADWFERVTIIERDPLPDEPTVRRGVPQARHPHVLLEAGRSTIEDLFPGFGETLLSNGGLLIDVCSDIDYFDQDGFLADGPTRLPMYTASRPLFEYVVRRRLRDFESVQIIDGRQFTDYLTDDDVTEMTGVCVRDADDRSIELAADLVVDATGRASRTPTWLERNGYDGFETDWVNIDVVYSTVAIDRPARDRRVIFVGPDPPRRRGGVAIPIEGERWLVVMIGINGDHPPSEPDGFVDYAESLPVAEFGQLLADREWLSDEIRQYPFPSSFRNRIEQLDRFPSGLAMVGDAIASYNPIHGQGMSVAALEGLALDRSLANGGLTDLGTRYFDRVEPIVDIAWLMSVGADSRFDGTDGPTPRGAGLFTRYVSRYVRAAHSDGVLAERFFRVINMERHPLSLVSPRALWRVFT